LAKRADISWNMLHHIVSQGEKWEEGTRSGAREFAIPQKEDVSLEYVAPLPGERCGNYRTFWYFDLISHLCTENGK